MSVVGNNYLKIYNNAGQWIIVEILAGGFTWILMSWWEKHLTTEIRDNIIPAIQRDDEGNLIFDIGIGLGTSESINTLIYTIM